MMCYSAQVWADYRRYVRDYGATLDIKEFYDLFCVWSKWSAPGEPDLLSFAAITDDPPEEVAAAGHDRCIIEIRPENGDAWLSPDARNLAVQDAILDDKAPLRYEHRLAA